MSELREKIANDLAGRLDGWLDDKTSTDSNRPVIVAAIRDYAYSSADAVLRVLAEHGDTGQVRELQAANDRLGDALTHQIKVADDALAARDAARDELADLRHNLAEQAFTAPDADDATMLASLHARIRDALVSRDAAVEQLERLHSWGGLLTLLDEHWPTDIFPVPETVEASKSQERRDTGPVVLGLIRWVDRLSADLADARQQLDHARADGQTAQRDLAAILRALGLGDHARVISSHYVVVEEVLPAIEHLRQQLDQVRAKGQEWAASRPDEYLGTVLISDVTADCGRDLLAVLDAPARPAGHDESGQ
jgi:hypothetical protein